MQKIRLLYYILVNVDIVYTPEACDDLWRAIQHCWRSASSQNIWYPPPPPPINIKSDLRFPREWPLRSWKFRISGKFSCLISMGGGGTAHPGHAPVNSTVITESQLESRQELQNCEIMSFMSFGFVKIRYLHNTLFETWIDSGNHKMKFSSGNLYIHDIIIWYCTLTPG